MLPCTDDMAAQRSEPALPRRVLAAPRPPVQPLELLGPILGQHASAALLTSVVHPHPDREPIDDFRLSRGCVSVSGHIAAQGSHGAIPAVDGGAPAPAGNLFQRRHLRGRQCACPLFLAAALHPVADREASQLCLAGDVVDRAVLSDVRTPCPETNGPPISLCFPGPAGEPFKSTCKAIRQSACGLCPRVERRPTLPQRTWRYEPAAAAEQARASPRTAPASAARSPPDVEPDRPSPQPRTASRSATRPACSWPAQYSSRRAAAHLPTGMPLAIARAGMRCGFRIATKARSAVETPLPLHITRSQPGSHCPRPRLRLPASSVTLQRSVPPGSNGQHRDDPRCLMRASTWSSRTAVRHAAPVSRRASARRLRRWQRADESRRRYATSGRRLAKLTGLRPLKRGARLSARRSRSAGAR